MKAIAMILLALSLSAPAQTVESPDSLTVPRKLALELPADVVPPIDGDLLKSAQRHRAGGIAMLSSGIVIMGTGTVFGVLFCAFGAPDAGVILFSGAVGGGVLTGFSSRKFKHARELRTEAGIISNEFKQFRINLTLQGYIDENLNDKTEVFSNNPLDPSTTIWSYRSKSRAALPNYALEMGVMTPSHIFYGVYGQMMYAGAMAVVYYEWNPTKNVALSAGAKAGYLTEKWTSSENMSHHKQYGGPELRVSLGTKGFKLVGESQLWIDKVAQYELVDFSYSFRDRDMGYAPLSTKMGVSPSFSVMVQFGIPM